MTPNEQQFIIWACVSLLAVIAFIGIVFVKYFMEMAKDVSCIKTSLEVHSVRHDSLEKRVEHIENTLEKA